MFMFLFKINRTRYFVDTFAAWLIQRSFIRQLLLNSNYYTYIAVDVKKDSFVFAYYFAATPYSAQMYQDPVTVANNVGTAAIPEQGAGWWYCEPPPGYGVIDQADYSACNDGFLAITDLEDNYVPS